MTFDFWRQLAITSVSDPGQAARVLLDMNIPRSALRIALALVAVLNTLQYTLNMVLFPVPDLTTESGTPIPEFLYAPPPSVYLGLVLGGLILIIYSIYWIGRMLGGTGTIDTVMTLIIWMQALRVVVQTVALVLMIFMPVLSAIVIFAAELIGLYMLLHFIKHAHRLPTVGRAAVVLVASLIAIVLGLSVLISLIGGPFIGSTLHV